MAVVSATGLSLLLLLVLLGWGLGRFDWLGDWVGSLFLFFVSSLALQIFNLFLEWFWCHCIFRAGNESWIGAVSGRWVHVRLWHVA